MNLNQVTVPARDLSASVAFYQRLGLELIVTSAHYARFKCPAGDATFSVHLAQGIPASSQTIVYFETAALDERVKQLQAAGLSFAQETRDEPWLWREARLLDPSGNIICLYWAGKNRLNPPWRIHPDTDCLETNRLKLVAQTGNDVRAAIERMKPEERAQVSPAWLALLDGAGEVSPWIHGFRLVHRTDNGVVGQCGFKGPPDGDAMVEIAYGIAPEHQGKGYATEAAAALTQYAIASGKVRIVRAHTLPEANASSRVLTKCGFKRVGEVMDPEDGLVWRWEKT